MSRNGSPLCKEFCMRACQIAVGLLLRSLCFARAVCTDARTACLTAVLIRDVQAERTVSCCVSTAIKAPEVRRPNNAPSERARHKAQTLRTELVGGMRGPPTIGAVLGAGHSTQWEDVGMPSAVSSSRGCSGINLTHTTSRPINPPWEVACGSTCLYLKLPVQRINKLACLKRTLSRSDGAGVDTAIQSIVSISEPF